MAIDLAPVLVAGGAALVLGGAIALWRRDLNLPTAAMAAGAAMLAALGAALGGVGAGQAVLLAPLAVLALTDLTRRILPNELTYGLIALGFALSLPDHAAMSALGAAIGFASLWSLRALWFKLRGVEALGLGDVKLLAGLGACFGPLILPELVFWAAIFGLAIALGARAALRSPTDEIPFGAALAAAAWLMLAFGPILFPV